MQGKRAERVATLIKHELAEAISRRIRDPRVGFVTVTDVRVSEDLKYARVFYSVMGNEAEKQGTAEGLERARGFFQREIAKALKLRFTPHLAFSRDDSIDEGLKVDTIIRKIHEED
ncbi:MAG: ribosome-binding factor A [Omnitrophica bacterium RIFCSPLOWO2_12_FULL_50_11]|nr:MAG: ribosome-binding factor A [Omnitrophica bacterium RIFCSPLOWO2_12_FULL_50_11]